MLNVGKWVILYCFVVLLDLESVYFLLIKSKNKIICDLNVCIL